MMLLATASLSFAPAADPSPFCARYHPIHDGNVYDPSGPLLDKTGLWHTWEDDGGWSHWTSKDLSMDCRVQTGVAALRSCRRSQSLIADSPLEWLVPQEHELRGRHGLGLAHTIRSLRLLAHHVRARQRGHRLSKGNE